MTSSIINYDEILSHMITIVDKVGAFQLEAKNDQKFGVHTKGDNIDYVTDIDRESEKMIVDMIHSQYPEHSILAEEYGVQDKGSDYMWVIDPIDGTTNYVHNFPLHCISIGFMVKGERMVGLVEAPVVKMRFTAIRGKGAYLNGERIEVSKNDSLLRSVIATGFPYFRKKNNINLPYFNGIVNEVSGVRRTGSAAIDCCFTAAGMVDGYWEFALNEYDICAGVLMIEEAGGCHTMLERQGIRLLVAGNPVVHDLLLEKIKSLDPR